MTLVEAADLNWGFLKCRKSGGKMLSSDKTALN
jgi:hypothetical protein